MLLRCQLYPLSCRQVPPVEPAVLSSCISFQDAANLLVACERNPATAQPLRLAVVRFGLKSGSPGTSGPTRRYDWIHQSLLINECDMCITVVILERALLVGAHHRTCDCKKRRWRASPLQEEVCMHNRRALPEGEFKSVWARELDEYCSATTSCTPSRVCRHPPQPCPPTEAHLILIGVVDTKGALLHQWPCLAEAVLHLCSADAKHLPDKDGKPHVPGCVVP